MESDSIDVFERAYILDDRVIGVSECVTGMHVIIADNHGIVANDHDAIALTIFVWGEKEFGHGDGDIGVTTQWIFLDFERFSTVRFPCKKGKKWLWKEIEYTLFLFIW